MTNEEQVNVNVMQSLCEEEVASTINSATQKKVDFPKFSSESSFLVEKFMRRKPWVGHYSSSDAEVVTDHLGRVTKCRVEYSTPAEFLNIPEEGDDFTAFFKFIRSAVTPFISDGEFITPVEDVMLFADGEMLLFFSIVDGFFHNRRVIRVTRKNFSRAMSVCNGTNEYVHTFCVEENYCGVKYSTKYLIWDGHYQEFGKHEDVATLLQPKHFRQSGGNFGGWTSIVEHQMDVAKNDNFRTRKMLESSGNIIKTR